ncbi:MAG: hypothetical protein QJT80_07465 [Candidatus Thiocaldithrix dubininis]|uniref:Uncharacterized protein n=1 Tax=Candidatus Thiocaldithrix dubininis TaxID=3080823 RepID=A0AA95H8M3_9GAMM|nr:MAG: hypothetical protein QJT80_07465 [Candidatus Thiocaldithrix dubininis]
MVTTVLRFTVLMALCLVIPAQAREAWVAHPPAKVLESPQGAVLCRISKAQTISIIGQDGAYYVTDVCGATGLIHGAELAFEPARADSSSVHDLGNSLVEKVRASRRTHVYQGTWEGIPASMYLEWEDYQSEGGRVRGFIQSSGGSVMETFKGENYAFRKIRLRLDDGRSLYLYATVDKDIKTWHGDNLKFSHKYK